MKVSLCLSYDATLARLVARKFAVIGQAVTSVRVKMWRIVWSVSSKELKRNDNSHTCGR